MSARAAVIADTSLASLAVAFAAVLFGTSGSAAQLLAPELGPLSVASGRIIVAGVALVVVACVLRRRPPWPTTASPATVLAASLAVVGFQVGFFVAVDRLGVAQATVLTIATGPLVAALVDHRRGAARLTVRWCGGAGLGLVGVALVCSGEWGADVAGLIAALFAGCSLPVYGNVLRSLAVEGDVLGSVAAVFGCAVPLALLLCATPYAALPSTGELGAVAYLGLVPTALAYTFWARGLRRLTVRDTVLLTLLEPVTAVLVAIAVLGEAASVQLIGGIAMVLAGLAWASTGQLPRTGTSRSAPTVPLWPAPNDSPRTAAPLSRL